MIPIPTSSTPSERTIEQQAEAADVLEDDVGDWPKGPYTQQIEGVLPPMLTEEVIMYHLQSSGKQLK